MSYKYNIKFYDTLADAFDYQNAHGGTLYVKGEGGKTQTEYDIAVILTEIEDEEELAKMGRFCVVNDFVKGVIERNCFTLK